MLTFPLRLEPLSKSSQRGDVAAFYRRDRGLTGLRNGGGSVLAASIKFWGLVQREGIRVWIKRIKKREGEVM